MSSEQIMKDKMFVKQHIRQAVLQRVGSKSHMENVDEETEARLAQVRGFKVRGRVGVLKVRVVNSHVSDRVVGRLGSKSHNENVDEEMEARLA